MLAGDERQAAEEQRRLQGLQQTALAAGDEDAARLLRVLEGMLRHSVLREAEELRGPHATALNRIANQVAGSGWKLDVAGQPASDAPQEPQFSTWEDVINKINGRSNEGSSSGSGSGGGGSTAGAASGSGGGGVAETAYYSLLGVAPTATQAELKSAYRKLALQLHPDVSSAPDASERFAAVAAAYDVLSDPESRALYDRYGAEGMRGKSGASSGSGNASREWTEFKRHKRQNKHTQARDASTASYGSSVDEAWGSDPAGGAAAGAVVEYPLSQQQRDELQDGRTHGVGLLVGRNCDRGDAAKLPQQVLDLCEIEPLRQEEPGSTRWVPDELAPAAFPRLGGLRPIPVDAFDQRFDVWTITAPLSEGCGGPELPEEVIL
ncbi:dnaJ-like protein subfamily B member 5-like [Chlorella sorokiniana]|uniref:DnaJ-like protein subfamily B member 5-like n=1 Tax=Chlorella sorokiniana TaxID=3076 RepID=A0A2P6TYL2_CHLSO|nr:dnaJ-like protein subfamily B member 5-like [Chlorella sorokiniana]|eukprot:PRW59130.1 dnaJ-like protein subfamily B member 5-like [Chlorella sorokiniana]